MEHLKKTVNTFLILALLALCACSSDNDNVTEQQVTCSHLSSTAVLNGDTDYFLRSVGYEGDVKKKYTIDAVKSDCSARSIFTITFDSDVVPGTYPIIDSLIPSSNKAIVYITDIDSNGVIINETNLISGIVIITGSTLNFDLTVNGATQNGTNISFITAHEFNTNN